MGLYETAQLHQTKQTAKGTRDAADGALEVARRLDMMGPLVAQMVSEQLRTNMLLERLLAEFGQRQDPPSW
jgi:hypothetical protein